MSAIAALTVKKNDGTTDIVYAAVQPSSGDNGFALWRNEDATLPPGLRPTLKMNVKDNGPKTARKVHFEFSRPVAYTDSTSGLKKQQERVLLSCDAYLPQAVLQAEIDEAVSQFTNLLVNATLRADFKAGIAPT